MQRIGCQWGTSPRLPWGVWWGCRLQIIRHEVWSQAVLAARASRDHSGPTLEPGRLGRAHDLESQECEATERKAWKGLG